MSKPRKIVFLMATNGGWARTLGELIYVNGEPMVAHLWFDDAGPRWKVSCPKTGCLAASGDTKREAISKSRTALSNNSLSIAQKKAQQKCRKNCGPRPEFWAEGVAL